jgi:hypothetical protein
VSCTFASCNLGSLLPLPPPPNQLLQPPAAAAAVADVAAAVIPVECGGCGGRDGWLQGLTAAARELQQRLLHSPPWLLFLPPSLCPLPNVGGSQEGSLVVLVVVPELLQQQQARGAAQQQQQQQQESEDEGGAYVHPARDLVQESYGVVCEYLAPLSGQVTLVQQGASILEQQQGQRGAKPSASAPTAAAGSLTDPAAAGAAAAAADGSVSGILPSLRGLVHGDSSYVTAQGPARLPPQLQTALLPLNRQQQQQQGSAGPMGCVLGLPPRERVVAVPHCVRQSEVLSGSERGLLGLAMTLFTKVG